MSKFLIGISLGCVSAAVAGYLLARQSTSSLASDTGTTSARSRSSRSQADEMKPEATGAVVKLRSPKQLTALKEDLRKRFKNSPSAKHDWPLHEFAAAMLETMTSQEL